MDDDDPELLRFGMGNSYDMGALYYDTGALYYDTGSGQQAQLVGESRVFSMGFIGNTLRFLYYDMEIFITIWKSLLRYGWGEVTHLLGKVWCFPWFYKQNIQISLLRYGNLYYDLEILITR